MLAKSMGKRQTIERLESYGWGITRGTLDGDNQVNMVNPDWKDMIVRVYWKDTSKRSKADGGKDQISAIDIQGAAEADKKTEAMNVVVGELRWQRWSENTQEEMLAQFGERSMRKITNKIDWRAIKDRVTQRRVTTRAIVPFSRNQGAAEPASRRTGHHESDDEPPRNGRSGNGSRRPTRRLEESSEDDVSSDDQSPKVNNVPAGKQPHTYSDDDDDTSSEEGVRTSKKSSGSGAMNQRMARGSVASSNYDDHGYDDNRTSATSGSSSSSSSNQRGMNKQNERRRSRSQRGRR